MDSAQQQPGQVPLTEAQRTINAIEKLLAATTAVPTPTVSDFTQPSHLQKKELKGFRV
jgi:hypothetical protein